jgi:hypothetical protein
MFPRQIVRKMAIEADAAIDRALFNEAQPMLGGKHSEVAYVAAVALDGIHGISDGWKRTFRKFGMALKLVGVYCHAAPVVSFDGIIKNTTCELADLLVVTDMVRQNVLTRRAALIQAKIANRKDGVSLTGQSSQKQLDLYQNWYHFDFKDTAYRMKDVNFLTGGEWRNSGTFGVIDPRFYGEPHWTQLPARPTPQSYSSQAPQLGRFIAEMVDGTQRGFGRLATPSLKTDWSKTVELLLTETYARTFANKAKVGPPRPPRGTTAIMCYGNTPTPVPRGAYFLSAGGRPPYDGLIAGRSGREGRGISMLHFEFSTDDFEQE